jgi:hypothetical protein
VQRTHLVIAALAAALAGAVPSAIAAASSPPAKKPVAYLHIDARVGCAQQSTCKILPPWMSSLRNPMDVVVYADGTLYYKAQVITVGRPGAGPHRCDKSLFAKPYSGSCNVSDFGIGYLKKISLPGPYQGKSVWITSETALIGSNPSEQVNAFGPYPEDSTNPAVPGHYSIGQLVDAKDITPGETETVDVTRTPVR